MVVISCIRTVLATCDAHLSTVFTFGNDIDWKQRTTIVILNIFFQF